METNERSVAILLDWLFEVSQKFQLSFHSYYFAKNIIHKILPHSHITKKNLQLFGCCAMHICSKHEDLYAPEMDDWVTISDKAFNKKDMTNMENFILTELDWNIITVTPYETLMSENIENKQMCEFILHICSPYSTNTDLISKIDDMVNNKNMHDEILGYFRLNDYVQKKYANIIHMFS